jgi:hypothetical protein
MFLKKQALLVFRGSPNPCFAYKNKVFISKGEILFYCRLALLKKQAKNFRDDCNTYEF